MAFLMGIDLGTSSLKVIIIDTKGVIQAESSKAYQFDSPVNGYAEQKTEVWWSACCECIRDALSRLNAPASEIRGISFSGQMHGAVLLDKDRNVIRPAILHCDARSGVEVQKINRIFTEKHLRDSQLNPVYTGFLLTSLVWVRDNEPELYGRVRYAFLPKDFLKMMLCGELSTDYSDASGTLAYDIQHNCWSKEVLNALDIPPEFFPECSASDHVAGRVSKKAAEATGLWEGTVVVNGGADQVMQAVGNGAIRPGQATVNIGTSGQVCFQSDRPIRNPGLSTNTFCAYRSGAWITMGATMSAGLAFKWFRNILPPGDYRALDGEIEKLHPGSGGLLFLPYLNGERTPHVNPNISGMFMGLNLNTSGTHMARAVMEGVTYALMQCIEVCGDLGLQAGELIASGGGARSPVWLQMQADIYNIPLKTTVSEEQACIGAAAMAGLGSGVFSSIEEACAAFVRYKDRIYTPNPENHGIYQQYYRLFKDAYTGSQKTIQSLTELGRR
ncbi:xylulokinase [Treponema primitia]|uniref:xylulokinase n=1 Tax=Treponema primitia TaxID=88058 RepID=UPI00397EAC8D